MAVSMKTLGIDRMSVSDRLELVEEIWDSIAADPDVVPLSDEHKQDLHRRLEAHRDEPLAGSSWDEVRERLRGAP